MLGRTRRRLTLLVALGMIPVVSGCVLLAAGAAGVAGVLYVKGEIKATLEARPPQIVEATTKAFDEMSIVTVSSSSTALDGEVIARMASDEKVTVTVKSESAKASRISIRVGTFGDETLSRQILDKIKSNLFDAKLKSNP